MTASDDPDVIASVDDAPLCHGCGLMSHHVSDDVPLCVDCGNRRMWASHAGPIRVVTQSDTYHETARCPAVQNATEWWHWRDEECCYADLGGRLDKCSRCHSHHLWGFDHYRGEDKTVIGHA